MKIIKAIWKGLLITAAWALVPIYVVAALILPCYVTQVLFGDARWGIFGMIFMFFLALNVFCEYDKMK